MPVTLTAPVEQPVTPVFPPRKRWTRAECEALQANSAWNWERLELINGELIEKMGKNWPHSFACGELNRWLIAIFRWVYTESPINVSPEDNPTSAPEPDIFVGKPEFGPFRAQLTPGQLALVVEVSDSTLDYDLRDKAALYARAGIEDYWVLDINGRRFIVHRQPVNGAFQEIRAYSEHEAVSPLAAPGHSVTASQVLL